LHFLLLFSYFIIWRMFLLPDVRKTLFHLHHSCTLFAPSLFEEFLLPIFRKTFVSYIHCPLLLFTWAFTSLPLIYLLHAPFCTSFIGVTCLILCPFQLRHLLRALLASIIHTPVLVEVFSLRHLSFCYFILSIFSEVLFCWSPSHLFSSLLKLSFRYAFLVCPLAFGYLLRGTILSFLFILTLAYHSYLLDTFLQFAYLFRHPSLKYRSIIWPLLPIYPFILLESSFSGHIFFICPFVWALLVWFFR